jgi:hypothetical protein
MYQASEFLILKPGLINAIDIFISFPKFPVGSQSFSQPYRAALSRSRVLGRSLYLLKDLRQKVAFHTSFPGEVEVFVLRIVTRRADYSSYCTKSAYPFFSVRTFR